jgi:DNA-binding transcriptional ArsR family regulator
MDTCVCNLDDRLDPTLFKALGEPTRLMIVSRLAHCCDDPPTVGELAADLPVDQSVVSRHLSELRSAGVLDAERTGRTVRYRVRHRIVADMLRALAGALDACADGCCSCRASQPLSVLTRSSGGER